ncbi:hypothetical protein CsSME_00050044 [Camellia sinensis var. sinensis]
MHGVISTLFLSPSNHDKCFIIILNAGETIIHSLTFLGIFQQSKHQTHSFSSSRIQNPDANSITEPLPTTSSSQSTQETHVSNNATPSGGSKFTDVISSNKMITNYIRSSDLDSALRVFENMTVRITITWNSIWVFKKNPGKISEPDTVSLNTMLACYLRNSDIGSARTFFDQIPNKDSASWNTMILGFSHNGMMKEARELFSTMLVKNSVSWNAMISGYVESGDLDSALELFWAAQVKSVIARSAMITGHMKFGKVTWNAVISGYVENCQSEDALKLFRTMVELGVKPNPSSLSSGLLGCSNLSALKLDKQIHQLTCKPVLCLDTTVVTALISMYCKCGDLNDPWKLFLEMPCRDVVTWNAMISGYAQHGVGEKSLSLFDEVRHEGIKPDWITFVGVLSACNHAGLVDLGIQYFDTMSKDYGVEAKRDHYTCMVDLLGRAGASRIHKNLDLAECRRGFKKGVGKFEDLQRSLKNNFKFSRI